MFDRFDFGASKNIFSYFIAFVLIAIIAIGAIGFCSAASYELVIDGDLVGYSATDLAERDSFAFIFEDGTPLTWGYLKENPNFNIGYNSKIRWLFEIETLDGSKDYIYFYEKSLNWASISQYQFSNGHTWDEINLDSPIIMKVYNVSFGTSFEIIEVTSPTKFQVVLNYASGMASSFFGVASNVVEFIIENPLVLLGVLPFVIFTGIGIVRCLVAI